MAQSKKWQLNKQDLKSLLIGLLITALGAVSTYALEQLPNIDFGQYTPFVVPVAAFLINAVRKWALGK